MTESWWCRHLACTASNAAKMAAPPEQKRTHSSESRYIAAIRAAAHPLTDAAHDYNPLIELVGEARPPAVVDLTADRRVVVHGFGTETSGIPRSWAAAEDLPGVEVLCDLSDETAVAIEERVREVKRNQDVTIASIHWGINWGYAVPREHVRFAHRLVDSGVDLVHGHSSHHPRPLEVYWNRLILYGCGDFINDYEGIRGYEQYRDDLVLMYFATLNPASGALVRLRMTLMQTRQMRLNRASPDDVRWLTNRLTRISLDFGSWVEEAEDGSLLLRWS